MTDPYRISEASDETRPASHAGPQRGLLRPVLWVVLIVSAAANAVTSSAGLSPYVSAGFGLITLASVITLIVHHYRHRRD